MLRDPRLNPLQYLNKLPPDLLLRQPALLAPHKRALEANPAILDIPAVGVRASRRRPQEDARAHLARAPDQPHDRSENPRHGEGLAAEEARPAEPGVKEVDDDLSPVAGFYLPGQLPRGQHHEELGGRVAEPHVLGPAQGLEYGVGVALGERRVEVRVGGHDDQVRGSSSSTGRLRRGCCRAPLQERQEHHGHQERREHIDGYLALVALGHVVLLVVHAGVLDDDVEVL